MNTSMILAWCLVAVMSSVLGAVIQVPDELTADIDVSPVRFEARREKRQLSLNGGGGNTQGSLGGTYQRNLYSGPKTSVDGTVSGSAAWMKGTPTQFGGSARVDATRNLYTSPNTQLNANAFAQRNVMTGARPHDSFGAGLEARRTLATGRAGTLEAYGGYQRQWNTPNRNNFNAGLNWKF